MATSRSAFDSPILAWMTESLNRDCSREIATECTPDVNFSRAPNGPDNVCPGNLLILPPLLIIRHRQTLRSKWRNSTSQKDKRRIDQDDLSPKKSLSLMMIDYLVAMDKSLLCIAMMQGYAKNVTNIHSGSNESMADPDRALNLFLITQLIEDILQEHLERSVIKRLFGFKSDRRLSKKCREKLQIALEIFRVQSQIDSEMRTRADFTMSRHQETETQERGNLSLYGTSQHSNSNPHSKNIHLFPMRHSHMAAGTDPIVEHHHAARTASNSIQDNSLVIDGSGNNITMIIGSPGRGDR